MGLFTLIVASVALLAYWAYTGRNTWSVYLVTGIILLPFGIVSALHVGTAAKMLLGANPFVAASLFLLFLVAGAVHVLRASHRAGRTATPAPSARTEKEPDIAGQPQSDEETEKLVSALAKDRADLARQAGKRRLASISRWTQQHAETEGHERAGK